MPFSPSVPIHFPLRLSECHFPMSFITLGITLFNLCNLAGKKMYQRIVLICIFNYYYYFFGPHHTACGILAPRPGIEPAPPAVEAWSPNHWTTREFPRLLSKVNFFSHFYFSPGEFLLYVLCPLVHFSYWFVGLLYVVWHICYQYFCIVSHLPFNFDCSNLNNLYS